ncbi:MAG: coproporphyrinogen III oxidase family protein [Candidatus Diapherotrites archaeon]|uniref:Coproporphyrinogen III oxidase family protein n=1 Tax=Candidatus Iainarchaeum sp. TaxID=3101447 RepID=A0A8T3YMR5_9ARCH|nr:coproporphyrinogen III oxidase family protein [Candidatus Diapherotrites archaeon]
METDRIIKNVARFRDVEKYSFIVEYVPPIIRPPLKGQDVLAVPPLDVYVHIPDCPYICDFCSFYKVRKMTDGQRDRYIGALGKEIGLYITQTNLGQRPISTLFFGGGTPTRLTPTQFSVLMGILRGKLRFSRGIEITVESTPDTLSNEILSAMKQEGVNRLSIGVQDFNDDVLEARKRGHTGKEAMDAFQRARRGYGFDRINIDLIYRLPKQSPENWRKNLDIIAGLRPDYVTLYHLRKERRTVLGKLDESHFPTKEQAIEMYVNALEFLVGLGYTQISANQFAKPGKEFVQQENKWHLGSELLGLGISAYSCFNGYSYRNIGKFGGTDTIDDYIKKVESGCLPIESGEKLTPLDEMCRFAVFAIKTSGINRPDGGIDKRLFRQRFGLPVEFVFPEVLEKLKKDELIEETGTHIRLTLPGLVIAEEAAAMFYSDEIRKRLREKNDLFGRGGL